MCVLYKLSRTPQSIPIAIAYYQYRLFVFCYQRFMALIYTFFLDKRAFGLCYAQSYEN